MGDKLYKSDRERKKNSKYVKNDNIYLNKHIRNKETFFLKKSVNVNSDKDKDKDKYIKKN